MIIVTDEHNAPYNNFVEIFIDKNYYHDEVKCELTWDEAYELREKLNEVLTHT